MGQHEETFLSWIQQCIEAAPELEFHNGTFDVEQLANAGISVPIEKWTHDTMFCQRVLEPELPIGLDFCTSIYTLEPYYKDDGKQNSKKLNKNLWDYGCKDVICTWQVREGQEKLLVSDPIAAADYRYTHSLIPAALELQRNGLPVDNERLDEFRKALTYRLTGNERMLKLLAGDNFNHRSPKQVQHLLYKAFGLPKRTGRTGSVTTNEEALVSLIHYCQKELETKVRPDAKAKWELRLEVLRCLLDLRECTKLLDSYINFTISDDGRVRHSIKIAGTETGRWAAGLYVDDTGLNAQTFPRTKIDLPQTA
jgi:DNA polymerase I-like protein with 3'-5' exonuclease and polymerase domains